MGFQSDLNLIKWRLHLRSPIEHVYAALATDDGRASFWAETAVARDGVIHFVFPDGQTWDGAILRAEPPHTFSVHYFGGSTATFTLSADEQGNTELTLTDAGVSAAYRAEVIAGWVSVLMALKAAVDFGVDLRNHARQRTWDTGYVEN